jgi:translation initiation factor 4E
MADTVVPLDTIPISPDQSSGHSDSSDGALADIDPNVPVTVFHNPEHFNVKHPLLHKWTLWFTKPPVGKVSHLACSHSPANRAG